MSGSVQLTVTSEYYGLGTLQYVMIPLRFMNHFEKRLTNVIEERPIFVGDLTGYFW